MYRVVNVIHINTHIIVCIYIIFISQVVCFGLNGVRGDDIACDPDQQPRIMTDPTGTFTTPNFPFNYPNDADCKWQIEAQPGQVMQQQESVWCIIIYMVVYSMTCVCNTTGFK